MQLFWSRSPDKSGILGDRLADPVPVYWNQASDQARVDNLPMRPSGAAFLLVITDADDQVTESDETNNVLVVGADLAVTDVRWNALNEPARWPAPPPAATHILVVADPDQLLEEPSEENNLSALRLHTPEQILDAAIDVNPLALAYDGTQATVSLEFQPGDGQYTMSEAEVALGVDHFN